MAQSMWGFSPRSEYRGGRKLHIFHEKYVALQHWHAQPPPFHLQRSDSSPSPTLSSHPLGSILESVRPRLLLTIVPFTLHTHISSHINPTAQGPAVIKHIMSFLKLHISSYVTNQICPFNTSLDSNSYWATIIIYHKQSRLLFFPYRAWENFQWVITAFWLWPDS